MWSCTLVCSMPTLLFCTAPYSKIQLSPIVFRKLCQWCYCVLESSVINDCKRMLPGTGCFLYMHVMCPAVHACHMHVMYVYMQYYMQGSYIISCRYMQITCRSHEDHMQSTCRAHAQDNYTHEHVEHMQSTCRAHVAKILHACRTHAAR